MWTEEEDEELRGFVAEYGVKKWAFISTKMSTGKGAKQCRRRWQNYLNNDLKQGGWTEEEDQILLDGHRLHGNKWTEIARMVGGRTDNAVKNRHAVLVLKEQKKDEDDSEATGSRGGKRKRNAGGANDSDSRKAKKSSETSSAAARRRGGKLATEPFGEDPELEQRWDGSSCGEQSALVRAHLRTAEPRGNALQRVPDGGGDRVAEAGARAHLASCGGADSADERAKRWRSLSLDGEPGRATAFSSGHAHRGFAAGDELDHVGHASRSGRGVGRAGAVTAINARPNLDRRDCRNEGGTTGATFCALA